MRGYQHAPRRRPQPLLILGLCAALAACSSPPPRVGDADPRDLDPAALPGEQPAEHPRFSQQLPPSAHSALFRRAEAALGEFDWMRAEMELAALEEPLSANDHAYRRYLDARTAWLKGDTEAADNLLAAPLPTGTAPALAIMTANFQRYVRQMSGDYLASARHGSQLLEQVPDHPHAGALKRSIWRDLERLPAASLTPATDAGDTQWRAWLELAAISARDADSDKLRDDLQQWRERHPDHPAANPLPGGLDALLAPPAPNDKVALMLPLSGRLAPAARAVRDGYLAAYYAARSAGDDDERELLVLDTHATGGALASYRDAVQRGATMVVGPLSKQSVAELGNAPERPVPVLALNRAEQPLPPAATALVQMSLAPDDEIETLARLAYGRGARRALMVRPAGEWGDKMETALREHWGALGGGFATTATYASAEAYSDTIQQAFNLGASLQRARDVRSMLATNIEYTARRRQDFDAIFLLSSSPEEARSIKPLLAFHYAGAVPVYATSSIYSGIPDHRDRDLNGIILADLPWFLGTSPRLRVAITAGDTGSDSYARLNALGADAYLLQSRFGQLRAGPDALLRGNTGLLSMDPQLRIVREPQPATFDGGELKPL
ncbi:penicillin-binding protein activator [Parahaliea mediterranea]|uniref:Penicillin-binding protein activator n=1 Tax=Parahaliea mediterranea TaxID=651086 RepID=A0A939DD32_9GAMM|nr:penicillin-binding protein activator [Parahaliea mediterranea]MBN7795367.1 penicillin-binding protein activator [Parahaliea mediterranea]